MKKIIGVDIAGMFYVADQWRMATGLVLQPIKAAEHYERTRPESLEGHFRFHWEAQRSPKSLQEFVSETYKERADQGVFDFTGKEFWEAIRIISGLSPEECPCFHCLRCGKVFDSVEWAQVYEPSLLQLIKSRG